MASGPSASCYGLFEAKLLTWLSRLSCVVSSSMPTDTSRMAHLTHDGTRTRVSGQLELPLLIKSYHAHNKLSIRALPY